MQKRRKVSKSPMSSKRAHCLRTSKLCLTLKLLCSIEITQDFQTKTWLERIGFRNKRKETKMFEIGTGKLAKCRTDLEKVIQER